MFVGQNKQHSQKRGRFLIQDIEDDCGSEEDGLNFCFRDKENWPKTKFSSLTTDSKIIHTTRAESPPHERPFCTLFYDHERKKWCELDYVWKDFANNCADLSEYKAGDILINKNNGELRGLSPEQKDVNRGENLSLVKGKTKFRLEQKRYWAGDSCANKICNGSKAAECENDKLTQDKTEEDCGERFKQGGLIVSNCLEDPHSYFPSFSPINHNNKRNDFVEVQPRINNCSDIMKEFGGAKAFKRMASFSDCAFGKEVIKREIQFTIPGISLSRVANDQRIEILQEKVCRVCKNSLA